jgi:hypothetical protein
MAKPESNDTPETALPDDGKSSDSTETGAGYRELVDWIKSKEEKDATLRVVEILTTDANAPAHERLTYSYPPVNAGVDSYRDSKGNTVLFEG